MELKEKGQTYEKGVTTNFWGLERGGAAKGAELRRGRATKGTVLRKGAELRRGRTT